MVQQTARPPQRGRKATAEAGAETGESSRPDKQSRLGNAAVADRSGVATADSAISNSELSSWMGADEEQKPVMAAGDGVGPQRPAKVTTGTYGALVGDQATVSLAASADGSGEKFTVPDGTACKVLESKGDRI